MTDNADLSPYGLALDADLTELRGILERRQAKDTEGVERLAYTVAARAAVAYVEHVFETSGHLGDLEARAAADELRGFFNWWTYHLETADEDLTEDEIAVAVHQYVARKTLYLEEALIRLEARRRNLPPRS